MKKPTGLLIWSGKSKLNGKDIVAITTLITDNKKTGDLRQVWILPRRVHPVKAINSGYDACICSCQLKGHIKTRFKNKNGVIHREVRNAERSCYVNQGFAPSNIWNKFRQGGYPKLDKTTEKFLINKPVRLGSMGDASAVPMSVWNKLLQLCSGHTAYTANWQNGHNRHLKHICQASVYTIEQAKLAWSMGWNTFRIALDGKRLKNEIICPASINSKIQCIDCMSCNGKSTNVVIKVHGTRSKIKSFTKMVEQMERVK